jgi:quinol monooxygenase YgiN
MMTRIPTKSDRVVVSRQQQRQQQPAHHQPPSRVICIVASACLLFFALTLSTGTAAGFVLLLRPAPSPSATRMTTPSPAAAAVPVFSLLVTLQFTAEEYQAQFLRDITPLCHHVRDHEPDTIAYQVLLSDQDPLRVVILERYRDQEMAFLMVHRNSIPFLEFRPKLQALQDAGHVTVEGASYLDASSTEVGGFGDRVIAGA